MSEMINLEISVNQPVGLKVIIIFSKRVDELLCHLQDIKKNKQLARLLNDLLLSWAQQLKSDDM